MPIKNFPQRTSTSTTYRNMPINDWIYVEIRMAVYGLPQAGTLVNKQLLNNLAPAEYHKVVLTSGLWKHVTHPVQFSLVVYNFGVKYIGEENADHLIRTLRKH